MKIAKLILNNFSSYEGEIIFDFTTDSNHPIILIGGQNGAGKTSLFTAIKIALYGPLAFGYTGYTSFYTKKIKSFINAKAFQIYNFTAGVSLDLLIERNGELKSYTIERNWTIINKKLDEEFCVKYGKTVLDESEKNYFESYLMTIIPPDLFDFFLFDGEEVGNIFSSEGYNKYVKNALLTMCGIDAFSSIQRFCTNYIDKSFGRSHEQIKDEYVDCIKKISKLENNIEKNQKSKIEIDKRINELVALIEQRQSEFLRAGGLPESKRLRMQSDAFELDKKRNICSARIKTFMEAQMPFFLLKDFSNQIEKQINFEEKQTIYDYVRFMISPEFIDSVLKENNMVSDDLASDLYSRILKKLRPDSDISDDVNLILDLSRDEVSLIEQKISMADDLDVDELIDLINKKEAYTKEIISINATLRNALSEDDAKKYQSEIDSAEQQIGELKLRLININNALETDTLKMQALMVKKENMLNDVKTHHVYQLCDRVASMMNNVVAVKTDQIREILAKKIVDNLHEIYRKNNLISTMQIDDDFHFKLYQMQTYTVKELKSLISNLGVKEFEKVVGQKSISKLIEHFNVSDNESLISSIVLSDREELSFELYKKIDLNRLSKGERQIFILALYQAMIQISGKRIPFIIDTPYARIDANHREEISKKFFPNISEQVVILSTDEEISEIYYPIIKPFVAKEYLLLNDQSENRTTVENRYFFEVG